MSVKRSPVQRTATLLDLRTALIFSLGFSGIFRIGEILELQGRDVVINLFIYLFIMLCQFHTIISAQIQTQEYTNYQSINGRVYATALRQLQQPLQNKHDTFYIRSLVI